MASVITGRRTLASAALLGLAACGSNSAGSDQASPLAAPPPHARTASAAPRPLVVEHGRPARSPAKPPVARRFQLDLVDASRSTPLGAADPIATDRTVPTAVYLPPSTNPAPLIVLAHGFVGHPDKFTELARVWADSGYVVAVPRFPLSNDRVADPVVTDIEGQAGDVSFVIDEMLARNEGNGRLAGRIDPQRIGLFGLSLGSLTVWNTVLGDCCGDDRIDALIQSDGFFPFPDALLTTVPFPVMFAHSDTDTAFDYGLVRDEYATIGDSAVMLTLHDALHATVGENTDTPADSAYQDATTVFWDRTLGATPDEPYPAGVDVPGVTTLEADGVASAGGLPSTR
jgi:dienelactone hydrolase